MIEQSPQEFVIDYIGLHSTLDSMGDSRSEELAILLEIYVEDTPQLLNQMREAITQNNSDTLGAAAHRLKSSSATLGSVALAQLCQQLELMSQQNNLTDIKTIFPRVEREYQIFLAALSTHSARLEVTQDKSSV